MRLTLLTFLWLFGLLLFAQSNNTNATISLEVVDVEEKPLALSVTFKSQKTKVAQNCQCDLKGHGSIALKNNDIYTISVEYFGVIDTIAVPNTPNFQLAYKIVVPIKSNQNCTLAIEVKNVQGVPLGNEYVFITNNSTKVKQSAITNSNGAVSFNVKSGTSYLLEYKNAPNYDIINIPQFYSGLFQYVSIFEGSALKIHPTRTMALANLFFYDLDSTALPNEQFVITSLTNNKAYKASTNKEGLAQILIPIGDNYSIGSITHGSFAYWEVPKKEDRYINEYHYRNISSIELQRRKLENERLIATRDSLFLVNQAALIKQAHKDSLAFNMKYMNINFFHINEKEHTLKSRLAQKAIYTKDQLAKDSLYFTKTKRAILSTFYRFNDKWQDKYIVVDFTCSMDPYIDELLLWFQLNLVNGERKEYTFFNDGDNIVTVEDKVIGKTGGFHYVTNNTLNSVLDTLKATRSLSPECSIDFAENNIEALIDAQKRMKYGSELIMVADNFAPVRDLELINQVTRPVRIVVCGVTDKINEDLIDIAYKTKGSIHTIEEDLMNIANFNEGETITINNNVYILTNGRFIWRRKANPKTGRKGSIG